jgi:hypothetical protein
MTHKEKKKVKKFHVLNFWMFSLEGFSCSLGVVYRSLGISKSHFLSKKYKRFSSINFFQFLIIKTLDLELDPDPLNADPQPWLLVPFRTS